MNQFFVAGIGNIYASEILFRAGIHPTRPARSLKEEEIKNLHSKTQETLREAIQLRGSSVNTYRDIEGRKGNFINRIQVYGRKNETCYRCQGIIEAIVQAGRSTFFCRRCQS
jgi:formamidopyrimidine-DNA glycosylase